MLTMRRKQDLMLCILKVMDKSDSDFLAQFKSKEEMEWAIGPEADGVYQRLDEELSKRARTLLRAAVSEVATTQEHPVMKANNTTPKTSEVVSHVVQQAPAPVFVKPQVLKTNKGEFKSIDVLKHNMKTVFPTVGEETLSEIFKEALYDLDQESGVEYLNEPTFTALIKIVKMSCENNIIESLGGVVSRTTQKVDTKVVHDETQLEVKESDKDDQMDMLGEPTDSEEYGIEAYPYVCGKRVFSEWSEAVAYQKSNNSVKGNTKLKAKKREK